MKNEEKKIKEKSRQCSLCSAGFEVWLDNLKIDEERKERISGRMLSYCPVCTKVDEK
jgi:hypothetical protein